MNQTYDKDYLFEEFVRVASDAFSQLEGLFGIDGVYEQVFGTGTDDVSRAAFFRQGSAWATLNAVFDYALSGRLSELDKEDFIIDADNILALSSTEQYKHDNGWERLVTMADARFGLDEGHATELSRVALLAQVDIRTVRNAVSNGEMVSTKEGGYQFIENASARRWLAKRRGFKPTEVSSNTLLYEIGKVMSPHDFASMLSAKRAARHLDKASAHEAVQHPAVDSEAIEQLESGVFALPLDTVFPLADLYDFPRKDFLACVMRVFFDKELELLSSAQGLAANSQRGDA